MLAIPFGTYPIVIFSNCCGLATTRRQLSRDFWAHAHRLADFTAGWVLIETTPVPRYNPYFPLAQQPPATRELSNMAGFESRHAGAASPARGCSRPFLVSLDNARQFGSFRIWLGSRHRLRRLHCGSARGRAKRGRVGAAFSSLAHYRRPFRDGVIDTICARPCTRHKFNNSKKEGDRGRLARPPATARIRAYERYRGRLVMLATGRGFWPAVIAPKRLP